MKRSFITTLAEALYAASKDKKKSEIDALVARSLAILRSKGMLGKKKELFAALEHAYLREEGFVLAQVSSVSALSASEKKIIQDHIQQRTKKDVMLREIIDPELLGGFKVRFNDTVLDASIEHQLKKLSAHLSTEI